MKTAVAELVRAAPKFEIDPVPESPLKPLSVHDVFTNPSPAPRYAWDGYLPRGVVTLLGAHGGTGKSTIALMMLVAAAAGRDLFNVPMESGPVLFVSLEDSAHVVRHRLATICRTWGIDPARLTSLHILDGTNAPELFVADGRGRGNRTPTYTELRKYVATSRFKLVVIDNASDAFGGDEIQRVQVRAFIRSLAEIAAESDAAVLLLAHVDKGTSRARKAEGGEGYSGSTAWHNSARSRLFLTRNEDGTLTMEHQKLNLGPRREPLSLIWPKDGLPVTAFEDPHGERLQGRADDARAAILLRMIAEHESRQQYASPAITSRNHVHRVLQAEPAFIALKMRQDDTRRIVTQCQRAGWLDVMEYRDSNRKPHTRWTVTQSGRAFAQLPAPTAPTAPTSNDCAPDADGAPQGAPTAPTCAGGVGESAHTSDGAQTTSEAA